ncbi:hypothetical protein PHMEG_00019740 [Phytophthora megakarya]|uniref:PiggyBac transposable element-derived protein domain-containing protein n=1 Tax=Phytophthora megakarya TaxID=4795 RepID=A0A225VQJ8_9STRA|nr:hypothetical protein PHMEG_00019740 [Phytophthora megakarya]
MARIRASKRRKTAAVATMARDIDFRHLWRQLRGAGWPSRRPRGIQTVWTFVSPDGVRTFVDTESKIDEVGAGENAEDGESGDAEQEGDAAVEVVRPSQIDTSAQLSQRTLDDLFRPESDSDAELLQAAVDRAIDVSASDLEAADSHRDPDANLQLLSEVSGAESEGAQDENIAEGPARVLRPRVPVNKDINFVSTDEDLSAYESYSSDESIDDAIVDRDDDIGSASEDDDIVSESNAAEMDVAFVEALHLGSGDASNNSMRQRSATLRGMAWSRVSGTFEEGVRPYPGLNMEEAQSVLELRSVCHSPMLTFFYFVPKSLWVKIKEETNRYCKQRTEKRARKILAQQGHPHRETLTQIRRRLMAKADYQTHEILHVMGLLVARMLCPQKRSFASHWCMTENGAVPAGTFGRFMPRNRCQDILRDLHFVDNEEERNWDKLWKLQTYGGQAAATFSSWLDTTGSLLL